MSRVMYSRMSESDKVDYCYRVYRVLCEQNGDPSLLPFPMGIDRLRFPSYRIMVQSQDGGTYQGPTIKGLIGKILTAHSVAWVETSKEEKSGV